MGETERFDSSERDGKIRDQVNLRASCASGESIAPSIRSRFGWMIQVVRIRLRFLIIVVVAAAIVSQWPFIRGMWDRWTWVFNHHQHWGAVSSANEYFCPMDPGVVSVWPAICPICNMDLVPRKKMDAVLLPEGVVARMQLSPYRIQLAGIKTSVVEPRQLSFDQSFTGILQKGDDGSLRFEAPVPALMRKYFTEPRSGAVRTVDMTESVPAMAHAVETGGGSRVQIVLDDSTTLSAGSVVTATVSIPYDGAGNVLAVPESAVINRGHEQLVYVETMPGMFDGVLVELGRRCGGYYPVLKGLKTSQRVASVGAFLIDAETRLNPSLAAGYFGANQGESKTYSPPQTPSVPTKSDAPKKSTLSREDQAMADKQRICPVTELPLNSMGGPVAVTVSGRKVFICCLGCEKRLKDSPEKYLVRIPQ